MKYHSFEVVAVPDPVGGLAARAFHQDHKIEPHSKVFKPFLMQFFTQLFNNGFLISYLIFQVVLEVTVIEIIHLFSQLGL